MSWCVNQGPSFNTVMGAYQKLNGSFQRFSLQQDDPRFTPGKRQPKLKAETMKGTFKLKKSKRPGKDKQIKYTDAIPENQPQLIYGGFSNIKNKASSKIVMGKKSKLKRQNKKSVLI